MSGREKQLPTKGSPSRQRRLSSKWMTPENAPEFVFKILRPEEWRTLQAEGTFRGSADDERDGFIHLSTEDQVEGTLAKHYQGQEKVFIAKVRAAGLPIKMEISRNNARFPHLYGALALEDIVSSEERALR